MKRTKTLTKNQKRAFALLEPKVVHSPTKMKQTFLLSDYLAKQEEKKHAKKHMREDRRDARDRAAGLSRNDLMRRISKHYWGHKHEE